MFLDASAVLGILLQEEEHEALIGKIQASQTPLVTSPVALLECVSGLASKGGFSIDLAEEIVTEFVTALDVETIAITPAIGALAVRAYAAYGKGRQHPAKLDMGDCLAYACAKDRGVPLLYRGHDFVHTDLR